MLNSDIETYNSKMCPNEASVFFQRTFFTKGMPYFAHSAVILALNKYSAY